MISDYVKNFIGTAIIGVVGWAYHKQTVLSEEVDTHTTKLAVLETKHEDLKTLINSRFDGTDNRLTRIEIALNGRYTGDTYGRNR